MRRHSTQQRVRMPRNKRRLLKASPDLMINMQLDGNARYIDVCVTSPKITAWPLRFSTDQSRESLDALCAPIAKQLGKLAVSGFSNNDHGHAQLREIRTAGSTLFNNIFNYSVPARALLERVWESAAGTIKILAEGDIAGGLPWELLMIAPPDRYRQKFEQPYLIGDRAIVYRPLKSVPSEGDLEKTTLRILALSHQHLPYAFREISTLERTLQGRAVVCHVDPVTSADIDLGVEQICKFIRDHSPCPIAHFACHNEVAQDPAKAFVIEVRDSFPFSRTHLNDKAFELTSNCFVFLNCCHSGASLSGPSSLVQYLLVKGAAAALATVCQIGDDYAEYMSQAVYKRMLPPHSQQGERLGEAVLGARMDLWRIKRSMAGYIYCLYGDPEWVI